MTDAEQAQTNFLIWPDDTVEELARDDSGDTWRGKLTSIYAELTEAGVPVAGGNDQWSVALDFAVRDDGTVVAFTNGDEPNEHDIPRATVAGFLERWSAVEKA